MSDMVKQAAIFAVYPTQTGAEAAVHDLRARGFSDSEISVVTPHDAEPSAMAAEAGTAFPPRAAVQTGPIPAIGVALGWLVGVGAVIASGAVYVAAGPVLAALKGASDTVLGIVDALVRFGIPEDAAKQDEARMRKGATLLSIHTDDRTRVVRGKEIFELTGAEDISSMHEIPMADAPSV